MGRGGAPCSDAGTRPSKRSCCGRPRRKAGSPAQSPWWGSRGGAGPTGLLVGTALLVVGADLAGAGGGLDASGGCGITATPRCAPSRSPAWPRSPPQGRTDCEFAALAGEPAGRWSGDCRAWRGRRPGGGAVHQPRRDGVGPPGVHGRDDRGGRRGHRARGAGASRAGLVPEPPAARSARGAGGRGRCGAGLRGRGPESVVVEEVFAGSLPRAETQTAIFGAVLRVLRRVPGLVRGRARRGPAGGRPGDRRGRAVLRPHAGVLRGVPGGDAGGSGRSSPPTG